MIKVALAEDNTFLAHSLINKLGLFDDFKVKFHALNGEDLLSKLEVDSNVDVILMDVQMPKMDGIVATKEVTAKFPHIKVIVLTVMDAEQTIYDSIKAGASGYFLKESSPQEIFDGIHNAMNGGASMSPQVAIKALNLIRDPKAVDKETKDFGLSKREKEVLFHLNKGLNYNQIASNLIISPFTVRRHIENLYKKLEVNNKVEAIQKAYQNNLI